MSIETFFLCAYERVKSPWGCVAGNGAAFSHCDLPRLSKNQYFIKESQCYILNATFYSFSFDCQVKVRFLESLSRDKTLYASISNYVIIDLFKSQR
jgi:hypothetical protein